MPAERGRHGNLLRPKTIWEYRNQAWKCVRCGSCRNTHIEKIKSHRFAYNCPAGTFFGFEAYYSPGRHEMLRALTSSPPELAIDADLLKIVYTCTLCGNCQSNCNFIKDLEPTNAWLTLREWLVEQGKGPLPAHAQMVKSIFDYDNTWQQPRAQRDKWAKPFKVKDASKEKAQVLYFVGCTGAYDPKFRPVVEATARVLQAAGVDFAILGKNERCCGSTMFRVGERRKFNEYRAQTVEQINALGVETIVTSCSGCFSTFFHEYPELKPRIVHSFTFMDELLKEGKLAFTKEVKRTVTFHDPCHTGRYSGCFDEPRRILQAIPGVELREMERIRDWSFCCGAGGGVKTAFPEVAVKTAALRVEEAKATGASTLVSACPFCENNLTDGASLVEGGMEVADIMTLVGEAL